jgi:hypothetical protein
MGYLGIDGLSKRRDVVGDSVTVIMRSWLREAMNSINEPFGLEQTQT